MSEYRTTIEKRLETYRLFLGHTEEKWREVLGVSEDEYDLVCLGEHMTDEISKNYGEAAGLSYSDLKIHHSMHQNMKQDALIQELEE